METGLTTREMTRQFRLQQWQEVFHDRKESGLTVNEYCERHGIARDRYYYWLKVAREAAIEKAGPVFAELKPEVETQTMAFIPQITVQIGNAILSVNDETPEDLLMRAVRVLKKYAE